MSAMNRIEAKFAALRRAGRKAFVPFITAGDPDLETTLRLIIELEKSGADVIELGIPFSDPMADGPVIQRASERALARGVSAHDCIDLVRRVREESEIPILLFTYFNPLLAVGLEELADKLRAAGVDGVLVTDLAPEEAAHFIDSMRKAEIATVFLVAPTSTDERISLVTGASTGFVYAVSRAGVTGARQSLSEAAAALVQRVRRFSDLPVAVGFGISTPEQVAEVWRTADAAVVGSRIVAEIERLAGDAAIVEKTGSLARWLVSAREHEG